MQELGELVFGAMRHRFRRGTSGIALLIVLPVLSSQPGSIARATAIQSVPDREAAVIA